MLKDYHFCKICSNPTELVDPIKLQFFCSPLCQSKVSDDNKVNETIYDIIQRTGGYPVLCAHRGGGYDFAPENTMFGFRKSIEHGARLLELDIRMSKDEHLVLMHWSTIDETTNGSGSISDYTLLELQKLDLGYKHPNFRGKGIGIATLKEFLEEFVPNKNLLFCFDFKDRKTCNMAIKLIQPYNIENRILLGAVFNKPNRLLSEKCPTIPLISTIVETIKILIFHRLGILHDYKFGHRIFGFVICRYTLFFWTKSLVDDLHKNGILVAVSGFGPELTKKSCMKRCIEFGADFIMTDRPDILNNLLHKGTS